MWCCGTQYQLFAALEKFVIDPNDPSQVQVFDQPLDMNAFLNREIDPAAAMTYNELVQVFETENPETGEGVDVNGADCEKLTVDVTPGGE